MIYIPRSDQTTIDPANNIIRIPSVPTSPLVMPCPTPAHSPAPQRYKLGPMADEPSKFIFETEKSQKSQNLDTLIVTNSTHTKKIVAPKQHTTGKITKYDVKNMPTIPKFRKTNSCHNSSKTGRFAVPAVPKFTSLDLYNPETDDVDSDSSEPSSPDSIDSVINALKPTISEEVATEGVSEESVVPELNGSIEDVSVEETDITDSATIELCLPPDDCDPDASAEEGGAFDRESNGLECQQQLVDFAEQLSAQLLKELNKDSELYIEKSHSSSNGYNGTNTSSKGDSPITISLDESCFIKRLNSEHRNLSTLREELRERRLMLANLKSHHYPNSSNSTSSTIHEEEEGSPTQTSENELEFDHFVSKNDYDANGEHYRAGKNNGGQLEQQLIVNSDDNLELCNDSDSMGDDSNGATNTSSLAEPNGGSRRSGRAGAADARAIGRSVDNKKSVDSWTHSNSTVSLDSPSAGGASTHHRYYHVFREGELESLINHHVASLHIVSTCYERSSWCVVAEKVQVWTI